MKIAMIDNYDSFTYNLVHYIEALDHSIDVFKNDAITLEALAPYSHILISPGFGSPKDAKISVGAIRHYAKSKKILGVCLGHQCIAEAFGGEVARLPEPIHGKACRIDLLPCALFAGLGTCLEVGRYHSLHVCSLGEELLGIAYDKNGVVMALKHRCYDIYGVQFHPESVLSFGGKKILENFLNL
ncbi:aminodeoxychorismate/anthranilate synthase component II [Helicobacter sp. 11S02596-1]|uniref:anthranilate synthase component II n=1 Tax=Helicobacter sp. 11S02596-1 TaxID=1476194 RepID=UPI000BA5EC76|nr:aminodeoxychorismate/anthranilate synthase component II [Helicobacter sp. 11S02596-1]PAF45122.1 hypothetical protein BJI48_00710 [Helicobacter sp. 11S02596-1]